MESKYVILKFCCLLLIILIYIPHLKAGFSVFFDDIVCNTNLSYTYPINCTVDKTTKPPKGFMDLKMRREVKSQQYSLNVTITANKKKKMLLSVKNYDACAFFEGRVNAMIKIFKVVLDGYGNIPKKCPIPKDYHYVFQNFIVDISKIPAQLGELDFSIITRNTVGKDFLFSAEFIGRVRRDVDEFIEEDKKDEEDKNNKDDRINKKGWRNKKGKKPRN